ncbi:RHO1 GDP-GTP exchange protein 2 [Ceratobasidium sp. 428]|nr:RHO1 GDP-GTP exchange protein 2 [Ceratobasidium sp. 428]
MQASSTDVADNGAVDTISSTMTASAIIAVLARRRSPDITSQLDLSKCGRAPISGGGFGDIYRGALVGGEHVAIKCARLHLQRDDVNGHKVLKHVARELYTWSCLEHDNVVKLLGLAQFRDQMAMISPWMDNGTLTQYIDGHPTVDRYKLCLDISEGVAYLHQNHTANVLISSQGVAKLTDFGCTELKKTTLCFTTTTGDVSLSMRWAAPEILGGSVARSKKADVYALGMTLLEAVTGMVPFNDKQDMAVYIAVSINQQTPKRPQEMPSLFSSEADQLWALMVRSWAHDPADRPSSAEVRNAIRNIKQQPAELALNPALGFVRSDSPDSSIRVEPDIDSIGPTVAARPSRPKRAFSKSTIFSERESSRANSLPLEVMSGLNDTERKRQEAIDELINTEREFAHDLEYMRDSWMTLLKTEDIIPAARREKFVRQVFWNIEELIDVSTSLLDLLTKRQEEYPTLKTIGDIFLEIVPRLTPFVEYGQRQLHGQYEMEKEQKSNPAFTAFVEAIERLPASHGLELNWYLTRPTTRLAEYPLLLQVVLKHTLEDSEDTVVIPQVVELVQELMGKVDEESDKAENKLILLQFDKELVFGEGEKADLNLGYEKRQLLYRGPLMRRGGAANENGDLQMFLFDHALLMAKSRMMGEREQLRVFRQPIPLEFLIVSTPEENAIKAPKPRVASTQRDLGGSTGSAGSVRSAEPAPGGETRPHVAPARPVYQKRGHQFTIYRMGKRGYSLALLAPTVAERRKWVKRITAQQEVVRRQSVVFDTSIVNEDEFVEDTKVNCAAPYNMGRSTVYGTDLGVFLQALGEDEDKASAKILDLADVQQIDVLEEHQLLIVLAGGSVLTFPLGLLESPDLASLTTHAASDISFFKVGRCLGRTIVCVAKTSSLSTTFTMLEPVNQNERGKNNSVSGKQPQGENFTLKVFNEVYIAIESSSIHFSETKLYAACTNGFQAIDLETLGTQTLLDATDPSLDFVQRREDVHPLSIYRTDGEFLLCYTEFAFYVNERGQRSKPDVSIYWEGAPIAFAFHHPYVMAFDPTFIEIRRVKDGSLAQVIQGNNLRCLFADAQLSMTNPSDPSHNARSEILIASDDKVIAVRLA